METCPGACCPTLLSSPTQPRIFVPDHRVTHTRDHVRMTGAPNSRAFFMSCPNFKVVPEFLECMKYEHWRDVFLDLAGGSSNIRRGRGLLYWQVSIMRLHYP